METFGVIFDMDGVLVNSYRAHYESWLQTAHLHGLDMTKGQFASTFGRTSRAIIEYLWPQVDPKVVPEWDRQKEALYREILKKDFPEMDGANDLIGRLREAGFAMAIGSSGPPENVEAVLQCLPNGRQISATVNGTEVREGKPHPEVFLLAAGKLHLPPTCCAVIEDAPAGVEAANRASMASIALTGTADRRKLSHADWIVDSLRELSPQTIAALIEKKAKDSRP